MSDRAPIDAVERHFAAVVRKDADALAARYAERDDLLVFVEGPRWRTLGHERVATGWRAFCAADLSVRAITWAEGPLSGGAGGTAWVAGIVDLDVEAGGRQRTVRLRGTHVLARDASGAWHIVHEHFSLPAEDPYGIGDWLPAPAQP